MARGCRARASSGHLNCSRQDGQAQLPVNTQKTAVELGQAGKLWTTRATRNLTATLERLRVDRQLEEALTHGADPLHLALVFGIDEKTAIRYGDAARQLLASEAEEHHGRS
ncbi:hypothetical protein [Streptomyces sp. NBC_00932]|uniref:hypothetical protein n=1 Tax=Streptomyces sp. NBC_00932 TaxID=2903690 RepID=UPI0038705473|nr:hypothetical protein OG221_37760 [Streptomyces sp. NBC_00932]